MRASARTNSISSTASVPKSRDHREILAADPSKDDDLKAAQDLLRHWDFETECRRTVATALAVLTGVKILPFDGEQARSPVRSMRCTRRSPISKPISAASIPNGARSIASAAARSISPSTARPDIFRAVYGAPQSDGTLTAEGGDTFIMFVTWDRNGKLSSQSIHQFGSATLDESSPHYADQTPLFVAMKTKPVLFTEDELKGHIEADYRPG